VADAGSTAVDTSFSPMNAVTTVVQQEDGPLAGGASGLVHEDDNTDEISTANVDVAKNDDDEVMGEAVEERTHMFDASFDEVPDVLPAAKSTQRAQAHPSQGAESATVTPIRPCVTACSM
jgi:hypothetical protein